MTRMVRTVAGFSAALMLGLQALSAQGAEDAFGATRACARHPVSG